MYYTELDPRTMKPVYVPKDPEEKAMQRALIQYRNPKNYELVYKALKAAEREDLIGFEEKCLIKPPGHMGSGVRNTRRGSKPEIKENLQKPRAARQSARSKKR